MDSKRFLKGFTLVELLVVIGIIAVLISMLLPALNRAREQANLVQCQSNLRTIGQLLNEYAAENNGYFPYGEATYHPGGLTYSPYPPSSASPTYNTTSKLSVEKWYWTDTLSLLNDNQRESLAEPANVAQNYSNAALNWSAVFHDTDIPGGLPLGQPGAKGQEVSHYCANCRILANGDLADPVAQASGQYPDADVHQLYPLRSISSIQHGAQVMMVWCAATNLSNGVYDQGADVMPYALDGSQDDWGHGFANPAAWSSYWYADGGSLSNLISLGNDGDGVNSDNKPGSTGYPTLQALQAENRDFVNASTWDNQADMRFRHMDNTTTNVLFVDGHVESRQIGTVHVSDICVNPIDQFANNFHDYP